MDLRHMRHFVAVAEERHFGRAAKRLNMAQPPLSQSIRRLEADLGVDLFVRSRRGVELTVAGRSFETEARRTLMQAELARKMARRAAEQSAEVRISFIGPALFRVLPQLLVAFRQAHPSITVRLIEQSSPGQVHALLAGDGDVGFVSAGSDYLEGCETLVVESAGYLAAVPEDWPIASQTSVTLAQLADQPFILPPTKYAAQGPDTLAMFKNAGLIPTVRQEAMQTTTTLSLVAAGLGCSIVMASVKFVRPRGVALRPIEDYRSPRRWELLLAWPQAALSPAAAAFVALARAMLAEHPEWLGREALPTDQAFFA